MLCQRCHKNLSSVRFAEVVDGSVTDLQLCQDCLAKQLDSQGPGFQLSESTRRLEEKELIRNEDLRVHRDRATVRRATVRVANQLLFALLERPHHSLTLRPESDITEHLADFPNVQPLVSQVTYRDLVNRFKSLASTGDLVPRMAREVGRFLMRFGDNDYSFGLIVGPNDEYMELQLTGGGPNQRMQRTDGR